MNEGWILLSRKLLDWQWWKKSEMVKFWCYLLLSANIEDRKWLGITIKRGQLATSVARLSEQTGLSVQTVRTCLARLQQSGEITAKSTNKFTVITICNYCSYQDYTPLNQQTTNKQSTNNQQTTNKQLTNNQQQLNNITSKQWNNGTTSINRDLGAIAPLSVAPTAQGDTPPHAAEISHENADIDAAEPTLTLTPPTAEKEKNCAKKEKADGIDFNALKDFFNAQMQGRGIPPISSMTPKREQAVAARAREHGKNAIAKAIANAANSKFLNAETDSNFCASFDWIFRPTNFVKVLEGNYNIDRTPTPRPSKLSGAGAALQAYENLTQMSQNGNNTDTGNGTTDAATQYLAAIGNF